MDRLKKIYQGQKNGFCRICGNNDTILTKDHFPPYSVGNNSKVIIKSSNTKIYSQNGLKFRTICQKCNGELLSSLDNEIKKLHIEMSSFQKDIRVYKAKYIGIEINTYKLIRGILGHYLGVCFGDNVDEEINKPPIDYTFYKEIRSFVLGENNFLSNTNIYYWYYPFDEIKICQFEAYIPYFSERIMEATFGGIIKYYPIAFWIVNTKESRILPNIQKIKIEDKNTILKIMADNIVVKDFPETPQSEAAIYMSKNGRIEAEREK